LDRRQFLRGGALAVAGIGALSGAELLWPGEASAQGRGNVFNVQFHQDLSTATPVYRDNNRLRLVRHIYEFDFRSNLIPEVDTYRIRTSDGGRFLLAPYFQQPRLFTPSPFATVDDYLNALNDPIFGNDVRRSFPPPPGAGGPPNGAGPQVILIYRAILRNPGGQSFHLTDWCSFYAAPSRDVEIDPGNAGAIQYGVGDLANPNAPRQVANYAPVPLNPWAVGLSKAPFNHAFFSSPNQPQNGQAKIIWDVVLNADPVAYKVEAFVPAVTGKVLTKNAQYLVTHDDGQTLVSLNQQAQPGQWSPLLDTNNKVATFRFSTGSYEVFLTNNTGETQATTTVMADGIRWAPA
jgi:hypothetical protein